MRARLALTVFLMAAGLTVFAQEDSPPVAEDQAQPGDTEPASGTESPADAASAGETDIFGDPFGAAPADDTDLFAIDDENSLFSTDEIVADSAESAESATGTGMSPLTDLLVTEGVRLGGKISGSVSADYSWSDVWTADFGLSEPTDQTLTPSIGADLFFDARPETEFRTFGKLRLETNPNGGVDLTGLTLTADAIDTSALPEGWTAEENENGDTEIRDGSGTLIITVPAAGDTTEADTTADTGSVGTPPGIDIAVRELFADYVWQDLLFFRFGKHTIRWGTGYFFSPADVLNLTAVDPEDPTAEREGPVSLRVQYPFGITGNAYLYGIVNAGAAPKDLAIAPKIEVAVGNGEAALGAYYQRTLAPRLIGLYSASIGEVDVFGEGVLLYGSDRTFVRPGRDQSTADADPEDALDMVLDSFEVSDAVYAQATAGFRYLKEWQSAGSLLLVGQYFFNGEGYADNVDGLLPAAARLLANPGENGLAIADPAAQPEGYADPPPLAIGDLANWGRHYAGLTIALAEIRGTNLGITGFALVNMSDWSGIVSPAVTYGFLDRLSLSASARFTFGDEDDELTDPAALLAGDPAQPTFSVTLSLSMPGGPF